MPPKGQKLSFEARKKKHQAEGGFGACAICRHPLRKEIELCYLHCIPFKSIVKIFGLKSERCIWRHAYFMGLEEKRDRKKWYWQFIENFNFDKVSAENALQAAIQLDKLEGKLKDSPPAPTNIQIVYSHPEKMGLVKKEAKELKDESNTNQEGSSRLLPKSSSGEISSEQSSV